MTPISSATGVAAAIGSVWAYTYVGYPLALSALGWRRKAPRPPAYSSDRREWPMITICMVAHNAESTIADTLERTLALDYPAHRRHILVASDASSDATDRIVRSFEHRGVQLMRVDTRCGKTACENSAAWHLRGDIVVNTDVGVVIQQGALKELVRALDDPSVGLASGRDVSVPPRTTTAESVGTESESSYVGYEMMLRDLESRISGIVGASGCLYAVRAGIQRSWLPGGLCRDFAAALIAHEQGLRSVSVRKAVCYVPRSTDLAGEFRRKRRTCTRGIATLFHFVGLLNPFRHGTFSLMLASHKLMRWISPWLALPMAGALIVLSAYSVWARIACAVLSLVAAAGLLGLRRAEGTSLFQRACNFASYVVAANVAVASAWIAVARRDNPPVWEPTRRAT